MEVRIDRLRETEAIVAGNQQRAPGADQHDIAAGVDLAAEQRRAGRHLAFLPALAVIATAEHVAAPRSEARREGKGGVSTCRSRWATDHYKTKKQHTTGLDT